MQVEAIPSPFPTQPSINATSRLQLESTSYDEDWLCVEKDEMINEEHQELSHQISKLCSTSGGCTIPKAHRLTVKTGYNPLDLSCGVLTLLLL